MASPTWEETAEVQAPTATAAGGAPPAWDDTTPTWDETSAGPATEGWGKKVARGAIGAVPYATGIGGAILGSEVPGPGNIAGGALGWAGGKQIEKLLSHYLLGDELPNDSMGKQAIDAAKDVGVGALNEVGGQVIGKGLGWAASKLAPVAEKLAVKATGATGRMAEDFLPGTGRKLLDNKYVRLLGTPGGTAERATKGVAKAYEEAPLASAAVGPMPAGTTNQVLKSEVIKDLDAQIGNLVKDPSKANVVKQLEGIKENILKDSVPNELSLTEAEAIKRGYANPQNWENPFQGQAQKTASKVYREIVEKKAEQFSPELGAKYSAAKKHFQMMEPVIEAGEKRASQLNQSPWGGLLDAATAVAGGGHALPAVVGRRILAPRAASTAAVTTDALSKLMNSIPPELAGRLLAPSTVRGGKNLWDLISEKGRWK